MRKFAAVIGPVVLVLLSGCGVGNVPDKVSGTSPSIVVANGSVHGGNQPVTGSTVQLWQVGTTGYGTGATPLGNSVISGAGGSFTITGQYSCSNAANGNNTLVYITATGGNPGSGNNFQLLMMAALGTCGSLTPSTFISINEVTTAASVYALAQFMSASGNIGSYNTSTTGLTNAFATVNNLVNINTGAARLTTPGGNGTVPQTEINTLGNIIAACINSASNPGTQLPSIFCSALFAASWPSGATQPTTTLAVLRNMALFPWYNAGASSTLFPLSSADAAFVPFLSAAPNDWTLAVDFPSIGSGIVDLAIDAGGDIWTANYSSGGSHSYLAEVNNLGVPVGGSPYTSGVFGVGAIAFDPAGDVWVANADNNTIYELASNGISIAGPFQYGETNSPEAIAVDGNSNVWVANAGGNSVTELGHNSGNVVQLSPSGGFTGGGLNDPEGIAIDSNNNAWITSLGNYDGSVFTGDTLTRITFAHAVTGFSGNGLNAPLGVAIDNTNSAWIANDTSATNLVSKFNGGGLVASYAGGGLNNPFSIAVDGGNHIWVANESNSSNNISEFTNAGVAISTATGYQEGPGGHLLNPRVIRPDSSGNLWVASSHGGLSEFVGLASPTVTPLSQAVQSVQIGQKPGMLGISNGYSTVATEGTFYSQTFHAIGGSGSYTWSITTGLSGLQAIGLNFTSGGVLSGTPTATGSFPFTLQVTDSNNVMTTRPVTLSVNAPALSSSCGSSTYSVSGTVAYSGAKSGRIYLVLNNNCGGGAEGTSVSAAGAFTIHGVPPGTYALQAFMDTLGYGVPNAADPANPSGGTIVTVGSGSVTGVSVTLSDPATVTLSSAPSINGVNGFNSGAVVQYNAIKNNGSEQASSYTLQWSTSATFNTIAGSKTFAADGTHTDAWILNGLTDDSVYYFRAYGTSAGTPVGAYSAPYGPVTIGAPTGGNSVSGTISFTGTATGPLYALLLNQNTNAAYVEYIANPVSPQAYTLQVPTGSYQLVGIIDQNNDGLIDAGDIQDTNENQGAVMVSVTGTTTNENLTLPSANSIATVTTQSYKSTSTGGSNYSIQFQLNGLIKQPVAVTLISGPHVITPIDIGLCGGAGSSCGQGFQVDVSFGSTSLASVGDTYTFSVTYSDGTTETVSAAVTGVLTTFATNLAPSGVGGSTMPTFTWTDPVCTACSSYVYNFALNDQNGNTIWDIPGDNSNAIGFSNTITSIPWNTDPTGGGSLPSVSSLSTSTNYSWKIGLMDTNGNTAATQVTYQPSTGTSGLAIQTASVPNAQISTAYTAFISVSGGTTPYSQQITSGSLPPGLNITTCTSCGGYFQISGTPNMTGTYNFTLKVTDSESSPVSVSQAYIIVVGTGTANTCSHDGSGNAILNGRYAFLLSGFNPGGHFYDEIGDFKADGAGNITLGNADVNGDQNISAFASGEQQYTFSGTYSIGSTDERGTATWNNANGTGTAGLPVATSYCFAADTVVGGVAESGRIIQADSSGFVLTGFFAIQNPSSFNAAALGKSYAMGVQGVNGTTTDRIAFIGQFGLDGSGGVTGGQGDLSAYSSALKTTEYDAAVPLSSSGSSYTVGSNGRGTMTLNSASTGNSLQFVAYVVGTGNEVYLLSVNNSDFPLLIGKAIQQTTTGFTAANAKATGIYRMNGTTDPNSPPLYDSVQVGQLNFDGSGNVSFLADSNYGGVIGTPSNSGTAPYTVSSLGYLTLSAGANAPKFYLYAPGGGFGLDPKTGVDFYYMATQTVPSGGFTSANLTGSYTLGTVFPAAYNISSNLLAGQNQFPLVFDLSSRYSSGTLSAVQDLVIAPGTTGYALGDNSSTSAIALDTTYGPSAGRFVITGTKSNIVGYIVSPTQTFLIQANSGQDGVAIEADHQ